MPQPQQTLALSTGAVAKLPDLGLPNFHGKYETWYGFIDVFNSVVNDRHDLSEIDKFLYLKICCKDDALKLIDSLDVTAVNYTIALDLLRNRYENKRAIINHHVNNILFNLPNVVKESSAQLRKLLDTLHQHKTAFEKLELPVRYWDTLLIPIVLQKLDDRSKREWENKQSNNSLPTLQELTEFLTKKCFTLEAININFDSRKLANRENTHPQPQKKTYINNPKCFYSTPNPNAFENKCYICHETTHFIYYCPRFINLSLSEKYNEVKKHRLCTNCLRPGHSKFDCKSSGCKKCELKHNTSLHNDQYRPATRKPPPHNGNTSFHQRHFGRRETEATPMKSQRENQQQQQAQQPSRHGEVNQRDGEIRNFDDSRDSDGRADVMRDQFRPGVHSFCSMDGFNCKDVNRNDNNEINEPRMFDDSISYSTFNKNHVLLSTATIFIADNIGCWHKCNVLLDSGSQSNLISQSLCKKLNLSCEEINLPLSGVKQIVTNISHRAYTNIKSRFNTFQIGLSFLVLPDITEKLPLFKFDKSLLNYPKNINLADEQFNVPKEIDALLGAGIFFELLESGKIKLGNNMPILQKTCLGWIFSGNLSFNEQYEKTVCNFAKITNRDLDESLKKCWQLEEFSNEKILSKNEQYCENYFKETTTRSTDGTFIVKYPFNQNVEGELGDSKSVALKRFRHLETRLNKNKNLKDQYTAFMNEYEALGHMTFKCYLDSDQSIANQSFFMPHSAVLRDSVTTKCRVVFDASAKSETGVSFNDMILAGPTIQSDLFSILLRSRLRKYVICADIKMMYRCILIDPSERDFQQILWRTNPDEPIKVYKLNTVTYGTASAPFQATRCVKELAIKNKEKYPRTSKIIEDSLYMDDLYLSVNSISEAIEIYHEITDVLSQANLNLRKWSSNERSILNYILQTTEKPEENLVIFHDKKELKTLGIFWDASRDILKYSVNVKISNNKVTKRSVLSVISQIFDPLGLIGPAIINAKLLFQTLWQLKLDWDEELPNNLKEYWLRFLSQIPLLNKIEINRQVLVSNPATIELYGFCDSSEKAYGACVYLCSVNETGEKQIQLLTAKSKVAPIKKQTLPRLELIAAHLLAELVYKIRKIFDIDICKTIYFTDSTIVLSWLKIEPCNLKTFVANRVAKITEISSIGNWRHVKSEENAADIISRGLDPKELIGNQIWFYGPEFLRHGFQNCVLDENLDMMDNLPELKTKTISLNNASKALENDINIFDKFSTMNKLRRVVAYISRFRNRTLKKIKGYSDVLTVEELHESDLLLIQKAQGECFTQEIANLKKLENVCSNSKILSLHPFLDSDGILRVGGRLTNSDIDYYQKHPIILPYKHKLTDLIILEQHLKNLHAGVQNLLSVIRLKFWPINGKNAVKRIIHKCVRCYRVAPKPSKFLMGSLPRSRVTPSRPFTNCGVDYAGPIYVKEGALRRSKLIKTYICIFICFATRAVHVELVTDMTTDSFLNALKRFCSRRGKPSDIYSDNGSNFIGANNYFMELYTLLNSKAHNETITSFLARDEIKWHFIPARSAHVGGLWEASVKSTKFHLKRVLGNSSLRFDEMYTLLVQIEACLNSRPLVPISNDINDYIPLTPSHFLIGDSLASSPEADVRDIPVSRLFRYQRLQQLYQQFWTRWSKEYLANFQTRTKWKKNFENTVKVGTLVVLVEDNMPPLRWPVARIVELHPGADNVVRVVSVRLANGTTLRRSLSKICVLPVEDL